MQIGNLYQFFNSKNYKILSALTSEKILYVIETGHLPLYCELIDVAVFKENFIFLLKQYSIKNNHILRCRDNEIFLIKLLIENKIYYDFTSLNTFRHAYQEIKS